MYWYIGKNSILFMLILCAITLTTNVIAETIISFYKPARKEVTRPGWEYLCNVNGEIGDSKNYVSRTYVKGVRVILCESGKLKRPWDGSVSGSKNKSPRYAIVVYTMQSDSDGDVWLINGNLMNRRNGEGINLKIYLNDKLMFSEVPKKGRSPLLFQCNFGKLKKGDKIYVAVGPSVSSKGIGDHYYGMYYTLACFAPGEKPSEPVNIISPNPTEATPRRDAVGSSARYLGIHKRQCESALINHPKLILLGDSITAAWNKGIMTKKFGKYKPANFGISGDWMQNVLWRVQNGVLGQIKPEVVVLMIGTNNLSAGYSSDEIISGIDAIIKALLKKSPESKILLLGIFPRGKSIHKNKQYEKIKKINAGISKFSNGQKIYYMDIGDKLIEKDGSISKEVLHDGLHPAKKGLIIWANAIIPTLNKLIIAKP